MYTIGLLTKYAQVYIAKLNRKCISNVNIRHLETIELYILRIFIHRNYFLKMHKKKRDKDYKEKLVRELFKDNLMVKIYQNLKTVIERKESMTWGIWGETQKGTT